MANEIKQVGAILNALGKLPVPAFSTLSAEQVKTIKSLVERTPDKWLKYHLDNCIRDEWYEIAAFIVDVAQKRGVNFE